MRNKIIIKGLITELFLPGGYIALIDTEDLDKLGNTRWYVLKTKYTNYALSDNHNTGKHIRLHRLILGYPKSIIDHKNRNGLDNRKENLRLCSFSQNNANRIKNKTSVTKYKGVYLCTGGNRWAARVRFNGDIKYMGCFKSEIEAAKAYNDAAIKYFGEFARLNILST